MLSSTGDRDNLLFRELRLNVIHLYTSLMPLSYKTMPILIKHFIIMLKVRISPPIFYLILPIKIFIKLWTQKKDI